MRQFDRASALRARYAVIQLADTGRGDVVTPTEARPSEWRLRVGDQREFLRFRGDLREIQLLCVRRRSEARRSDRHDRQPS